MYSSHAEVVLEIHVEYLDVLFQLTWSHQKVSWMVNHANILLLSIDHNPLDTLCLQTNVAK